MTQPTPSFTVKVDVTNPGQVFACCGLLELAHRQWPGAEGWFERSHFAVAVPTSCNGGTLTQLVEALSQCQISGLSEAERRERETLEAERRKLKKLSTAKDERLKELGTKARKGAIQLEQPFNLMLDWWQMAGDDTATPKTWAGLQELHKVARAAQDALSGITNLTTLFDHGCVLRMPQEYRKGKADHKKPVEPFYFDARRFAHPLDTGFSLDKQDAETIAHPAVELLCLVGLQRFRPAAEPERRMFFYWTWSRPLAAPVAAGVLSGVVATHPRHGHRFQLRFRDDQKRYKAFGVATPIGEHI